MRKTSQLTGCYMVLISIKTYFRVDVITYFSAINSLSVYHLLCFYLMFVMSVQHVTGKGIL